MNRINIRHKEIRYYQSYTDDFVESKNQSFQLPQSYVWAHKNILYRIGSMCLYRIAQFIAFPYCRFILHLKLENQAVLKQCRTTGYFVYGNHTQPVGDVLIPAKGLAPKRCYTIASPANLGIPFLGHILPMLGALPIADGVAGMKQLQAAISLRIKEKCPIIIYPEGHVWPWYTGIRPYSATSFGFPVKNDVPCFSMTTTYQKRKHSTKPKITLYFDGPFYPDRSMPQKKQKEMLHNQVYESMVKRSKLSTFEYIRYERSNAI